MMGLTRGWKDRRDFGLLGSKLILRCQDRKPKTQCNRWVLFALFTNYVTMSVVEDSKEEGQLFIQYRWLFIPSMLISYSSCVRWRRRSCAHGWQLKRLFYGLPVQGKNLIRIITRSSLIHNRKHGFMLMIPPTVHPLASVPVSNFHNWIYEI